MYFKIYMKEGSLEIAVFFYITVVLLTYLPTQIKPAGKAIKLYWGRLWKSSRTTVSTECY